MHVIEYRIKQKSQNVFDSLAESRISTNYLIEYRILDTPIQPLSYVNMFMYLTMYIQLGL